jgi:hypothetical protein
MTGTHPPDTEQLDLKITGTARRVLELASQSGWILAPGFPRSVRRPGNLRRVTQLYLHQADRSTLILEYTRRGDMHGHQTLSKTGRHALWLIRNENELLAAVVARDAVHRPPDVPDERLLARALQASASKGDRVARKALSRAGVGSNAR